MKNRERRQDHSAEQDSRPDDAQGSRKQSGRADDAS